MILRNNRYYPRKFFKNNHEGIPYKLHHRMMQQYYDNPVLYIILLGTLLCFIVNIFTPWAGQFSLSLIPGCLIVSIIWSFYLDKPYRVDNEWVDQWNIRYSHPNGKTIVNAYVPSELLENLPKSELLDLRVIRCLREYMYYTKKSEKLLQYTKNLPNINGSLRVIEDYKKVYEWYMGRAATMQERINTYLTSKAEAHKQECEEHVKVKAKITGVEKLPAE